MLVLLLVMQLLHAWTVVVTTAQATVARWSRYTRFLNPGARSRAR